MANDSASGGYLAPTNPPAPPLEGEALEDFIHDFLVGVTGLSDQLVRPAWQAPNVPNVPIKGTVWMAFHFVDTGSDSFPFIGQFQNDDGSISQSQQQVNEEFNVHCSIYGTGAGSGARAMAKLLRDAVMVPQNQKALFKAGMAIIAAPSTPQPVPSLVNEVWLYRIDLDIPIRRIVVRDYPVQPLDSADVSLIAQLSDELKIEETIQVEE